MHGHVVEDLTPEQLAVAGRRYGELTGAVRDLIDATVLTEVGDDDAQAALTLIREAAEILRSDCIDGSFGVRWDSRGGRRNWGNAAMGLRNPIAPPLDIVAGPDGVTYADVTLGAAYEGPPTLVHGGVLALMLDQVLGDAAVHAGAPGMTGTLTVRYRAATPLHRRLRVEAWLDRIDGVKTFITGRVVDDATVTVEAEGVFILPKAARGNGDAPPPGLLNPSEHPAADD